MSFQDGRDDRGETLIELLVTVVIVSTAVIALVAALATAIRVSDIHRKQAKAGAAVRAFAEAIETGLASSVSGYDLACTGKVAYEALYPAPSDYGREVVSIRYWTSSGFGTTCPAASDLGLQELTLRVWSTDARQSASEELVVVVRRPCRVADPLCA